MFMPFSAAAPYILNRKTPPAMPLQSLRDLSLGFIVEMSSLMIRDSTFMPNRDRHISLAVLKFLISDSLLYT